MCKGGGRLTGRLLIFQLKKDVSSKYVFFHLCTLSRKKTARIVVYPRSLKTVKIFSTAPGLSLALLAGKMRIFFFNRQCTLSDAAAQIGQFGSADLPLALYHHFFNTR